MPQQTKTRERVRRKTLLVDTSKCIGCRACQVACKEWHETKSENMIETDAALSDGYESPKDLSYKTWIRVQSIEAIKDGQVRWLFKPTLCLHCSNAACLEVCPQTKCIYKDPKSGNSVVLNDRRCIGCLYCVYVCPFSIPRYNPKTRTAYKCSRCYDKVGAAGESHLPACVQACPSGALAFGDSEEIIALARKRVDSLQASGKRDVCIYGERATYLGGLGVIYILESPDTALYGLPLSPYVPASVSVWQGLWKPLTYVMPAVVLLFWILHYAVIGPLGVKVVEEPEEEEIELTPEEYDRMIRAKREAGKMMQVVDKKKFLHRRHKLPRKRFPPKRGPGS